MTDRRCDIIFHGRVQGVGFRAATLAIAQRLRITGWVRNEPDGSVRLVAEGPESEVDALLEGINDRLGQFIHNRTDTFSTSRHEFVDFEIRR